MPSAASRLPEPPPHIRPAVGSRASKPWARGHICASRSALRTRPPGEAHSRTRRSPPAPCVPGHLSGASAAPRTTEQPAWRCRCSCARPRPPRRAPPAPARAPARCAQLRARARTRATLPRSSLARPSCRRARARRCGRWRPAAPLRPRAPPLWRLRRRWCPPPSSSAPRPRRWRLRAWSAPGSRPRLSSASPRARTRPGAWAASTTRGRGRASWNTTGVRGAAPRLPACSGWLARPFAFGSSRRACGGRRAHPPGLLHR